MRPPTILHYLGYDEDRGGVLTAVRQLAAPGGARHVLAVNRGFVARRRPCLKVWRGPAVLPETISPGNAWLALRAAAALVRHTARRRLVVHGQSRAGLLVALWLWLLGQDAIVVSPDCYGRRRWFYRWAAGCLGARWTWLSPAMKRHYDAGTGGWAGCLPEPAPPAGATPARPRHPPAAIVLGMAATTRDNPPPAARPSCGAPCPSPCADACR